MPLSEPNFDDDAPEGTCMCGHRDDEHLDSPVFGPGQAGCDIDDCECTGFEEHDW